MYDGRVSALETILRSLRLRTAILSRAELGGRWGVSTRGARGVMIFHGVVEGRALARRVAGGAVEELGPGDVVVFTRGEPHEMLSERGATTQPITALPADVRGGVPRYQLAPGRGSTRLVCGTFSLDHAAHAGVVDLMPRLLVGRSEDDARRRWATETVRLLDTELERRGASARVLSLADALLCHALEESAARTEAASGLFAAARDPRIAKALALVHGEPSRDWSAGDLARAAGMSRTRFFDRFSELVGEPPARYLARWRVQAAADLLRRGAMSLAEVAETVGYGSEDGLSRAFKRVLGVGPAEYRRAAPN